MEAKNAQCWHIVAHCWHIVVDSKSLLTPNTKNIEAPFLWNVRHVLWETKKLRASLETRFPLGSQTILVHHLVHYRGNFHPWVWLSLLSNYALEGFVGCSPNIALQISGQVFEPSRVIKDCLLCCAEREEWSDLLRMAQ